MSTRSYIGLKQPNGTVDYIYCHFDGYPKHNGQILIHHYQNIDKVNQLLELGDLSILGEEIGEKQDFNDRSTHNEKWCLSYGRDRGELNRSKYNLPFEELIAIDDMSEYIYIFNNDKLEPWVCYDTCLGKYIDLYEMWSVTHP